MTPSRDGNSFGLTPKATPFRDELRINEDVELQDSAKLELRRQAELRKSLRSGFASIPQPKNEYQIVMPPITEDEKEEAEERIEEDMSDRLARERAEEQARQEALLRKRSKVLQRSLPRPPAASVEVLRQSLIKGGESRSRSTFVPPTSLEQADDLIHEELLRLLEHDNAKYPLDEKTQKEKKKGNKRQANATAVPEIEDFHEDALKEVNLLFLHCNVM
jgi:pre-mRNA-splicing factor CDC5/CEF1